MNDLLKWMLEYIDDLVDPRSQKSVKSWVYLFAAIAAGISATMMAFSAAFVGIFIVLAPFVSGLLPNGSCAKIEMDGAFWPPFFICLTGLFAALFGYAASAKKAGDDATKAIELAKVVPTPVAAPSPVKKGK
jgi:hypothetical protein